jgi:hypothetical protein
MAGRPGIVRAVPFDLGSLSVKGSPLPIVDSVERGRNSGGVYFAVSRNRVCSSTRRPGNVISWCGSIRAGVATPVSADREAFRGPQVSPDGRRIVVAINDETRRSDLWVYDAERGTKSRLTNEGHNLKPVWSPRRHSDHVQWRGDCGDTLWRRPASYAALHRACHNRGCLLGQPHIRRPGHRTANTCCFRRTKPTSSCCRATRRTHSHSSHAHRTTSSGSSPLMGDGCHIRRTNRGALRCTSRDSPSWSIKFAISSDGGREAVWSRDGRETVLIVPAMR